MTRPLPASRRDRGAMILAFALTLTLIASITSMLMARTLMDHKRLNERRRDLWRAFYFAESGIAQVQQWALHPDDYTFDTDLFVEVNETGSAAERYTNLAAALNGGGFTVSESNLDALGAGRFITETGWNLGRIKEISILPPDPANDPITCFFKIESTGRSTSGRERKVTGYANANPVIEIQLPAALISLTTAAVYGNGKVHWGEAWTKTGFDVPNRSQMTYILSEPDSYAKYRTEATFNFPANWQFNPSYQSGKLYSPTADQPGLFPTGDGDWAEVFYQNVPVDSLPWPDLASQYQEFKDLALANGRYFTTNAGGQILKDGNVINFLDEFGITDHVAAPHDLAFIDTTDGNPPASDGSNMITIQVSGNDPNIAKGLKGLYYINANLDFAGVGNPPQLVMPHPDGPTGNVTDGTWVNGVLYAAGDIEFTGNPVIYGSVVAEKGFSGGGTPDIYYNQDLADGMILDDGNVGSPFDIVLHNNFAP